MKALAVALAIAMVATASADDGCLLSQEHQEAIRARVLARYPGGTTTEAGDLRWVLPEKLTFFSYGGCNDLGSAAWEARRADEPLTDGAVRSVALQLAERFWTQELMGSDSQALGAMREGLAKENWKAERSSSMTRFSFSHATYSELAITHSYDHGWDTVAIEWQGAF